MGNVVDLQLPVQSVPITTKFVSLNPEHCKKVLDATLCDTFVSNLRQVGDFLQFLSPIKLTATLIIVEILMEMALNTTTLTLL